MQGVFAHKVVAKQAIAVGDERGYRRRRARFARATMRNHTGTHLLHAALREVLGKHVKQAGSLVTSGSAALRLQPLYGVSRSRSCGRLKAIVNRQVLKNTPVQTLVDVPIDIGGERVWGDGAVRREVWRPGSGGEDRGLSRRSFAAGRISAATGEIGLLKLVGESSVASGVRRVEAGDGDGSARGVSARDFEVARVVPGGGAGTAGEAGGG